MKRWTNIKNISVKLTDKYIYTYSDKLKKYDSKYIKNGTVDNVFKLIDYLNKILEKNIFKIKYTFILDTLLSNSDLFTFKYVFESMGLINYKIINDLDIIKNHVTDNNIIIMNWSSSINYCFKLKDEIVVNKYNTNVINSLDKDYILMIGDTNISTKIKKPIYKYEHEELVIFNYL